MGLFTNQETNDLLLVKLTNDTLRFNLSIMGEELANVKKYKVCLSRQSLPHFLILNKDDKLYYYFFEDNKWKKKFLCTCQENTDFYLTVDSSNHAYLLIESETKESYKFFCRLAKHWSEKVIIKNQEFKLLKWSVDQNKIFIVGTTGNSLTFWQATSSTPEEWSKIYEYPLTGEELLNIWFRPFSGLEFLTADYNSVHPVLVYNSLEPNGESLNKQAVARIQLEASKPLLLRDTYNKGIVYTANNQLFLYKYSKKDRAWVELPTDMSLSPLAFEEITTATGIANSRLALTKILNMVLEMPLLVRLDDLVRALEIKKAQSLGFYGIRKLGR